MAVVPLTADLDLGRDALGGKAWGIVEMLRLGIPVPPAFCITTDECAECARTGEVRQAIRDELPAAMRTLEEATGRRFGDPERPLLVSVRSGAPISMPGMMDTVLNLGMDDAVQEGLARLTGDEAFAANTRERFVTQYTEVIGSAPPADPQDQLIGAIRAVFDSWQSDRAVHYRENRGIDHGLGTAVTVQAMVFGNADPRSGTGVLFTRDPLSGAPEPFGEWLPEAQGEDVVSGSHDPLHLADLAMAMPSVHDDLLRHARTLEREHRDMQDIEFTVEAGRLWLLQARAGKRSPDAAVRLAVQLAEEGLIGPGEALDRVSAETVEAMMKEHVDPASRASATVVASGRPACPGFARGVVVVDVDEAEERASEGESVILARPVTTPNDLRAMSVVDGIVTELGGATSHAAVVSRELGVPCVVGVGKGTVTAMDGRTVTVVATDGVVYDGELGTVAVSEAEDPALAHLGAWAREEAAAGEGASLPDLLRARARASTSAAAR